MRLRSAGPEDAAALAEAHASAFAAPWSADDLGRLLADRGAFALAAETDAGEVAGFVLCRVIAGEAEMLTLAVRPAHRRGGVGATLVAAAAGLAAQQAEAMFLEVAVDNAGAVALYEKAGFAPVGRRAGYYARPGDRAVDALVMRRPLNS